MAKKGSITISKYLGLTREIPMKWLSIAVLALSCLMPHHSFAATTGRVECTQPSYTPFNGQDGNLSIDCNANLRTTITNSTAIPVTITTSSGSTQINCSASGASTSNVACSLAAAAGKTTSLASFSVTCQTQATTSVTTTFTMAGLKGSNETYQFVQGTTAQPILQRAFSPALPASAANTAITLTLSGVTNGTNCSVNAEGAQQ